MDKLRFRAGSLLGLAGLLYVAHLVDGLDAATMLTVLLGAACLAISTLMLQDRQAADYAGGIAALAGLWAAAAGLGRVPLLLSVVLTALDVLVAAGCFYLVMRPRRRVVGVSVPRTG